MITGERVAEKLYETAHTYNVNSIRRIAHASRSLAALMAVYVVEGSFKPWSELPENSDKFESVYCKEYFRVLATAAIEVISGVVE